MIKLPCEWLIHPENELTLWVITFVCAKFMSIMTRKIPLFNTFEIVVKWWGKNVPKIQTWGGVVLSSAYTKREKLSMAFWYESGEVYPDTGSNRVTCTWGQRVKWNLVQYRMLPKVFWDMWVYCTVSIHIAV